MSKSLRLRYETVSMIQQSNLCTSFKNFFINKILKIRMDIVCQVVQHQLNILQSLTERLGFFQWISPSTRGRSGFYHQLYEVQEFSNRHNSNCRSQTVRRYFRSISGPSCQSIIQCRSMSLTSSSWGMSSLSSRRQVRTLRIHPTTALSPTWSPSQRSWRGWYWLAWDHT